MSNSDSSDYLFQQSLNHIDHITYVDHWENESHFINRWQSLGFKEHVRLHTQRYPASHIALISGNKQQHSWETMTGLSVSKDPNSPINQFINRYGAGIQHSAFSLQYWPQS